MIDYEGLPAPKEYYDDIGTVITPETWFKISGIEYTPARMPRRTPPRFGEGRRRSISH